MENPVELDLEITDSSDMDIQVFDGGKYVWLPRSQTVFELVSCEWDSPGGCMAAITMPEGLALKKGLI